MLYHDHFSYSNPDTIDQALAVILSTFQSPLSFYIYIIIINYKDQRSEFKQ